MDTGSLSTGSTEENRGGPDRGTHGLPAAINEIGPEMQKLGDVVPLAQRPTSISDPGSGEVEVAKASRVSARSKDRTWPAAALRLRPWKVVVGSLCLTMATFGLLSAVGLFATYLSSHQLAAYSSSQVSWIISVFGFLDCLFGGPAGILFDRYGTRYLLPTASAGYTAAFLGLAFSRTYFQIMACFVVAGVFAAIPTTIAFSIVSQWFPAGAGLATGIVTLGAAVGGIFFSLVLRVLFARFSWTAAMLGLSGIILGLMLIGVVLVENRDIKEGDHSEHSWASAVPCFRCTRFWLVSFSIFIYELVLFILWGSLAELAVSTGLGDEFYLMVAYNSGAILGRTLPPWLSDRKLGPINTIVLTNVFALVVVFCLWLPAGNKSPAGLFVVVTLMGAATGSFVPLGVGCVNTLCAPESLGTWLGCCYTLVSFATLIGNPITEAILARYNANALVVFLGAALVSSLLGVLILRWLCHERKVIIWARI